MKQYVVSILAPYFASEKFALNLDADQECIWQIAGWSATFPIYLR
jgi:hypothetical protein